MDAFVSIKKSMDDIDVVCNVSQGDIILLRHPNKMYLSFVGKAKYAKFFVNAHYSPTLTSIPFVNEAKCSDAGANLGDIILDKGDESSSDNENWNLRIDIL